MYNPIRRHEDVKNMCRDINEDSQRDGETLEIVNESIEMVDV